jgi:uncharacterized repeat protein (TIGR02543 family)
LAACNHPSVALGCRSRIADHFSSSQFFRGKGTGSLLKNYIKKLENSRVNAMFNALSERGLPPRHRSKQSRPILKMHKFKRIVVVLAVAAGLVGTVFADSINLSETWKDLIFSDGFGMISKDTGTLTASLTIPGLSSLSKNDWSNLLVSVSMTPYQGSQFTSDVMSDAPNWGGTVTATSATFFFQAVDTNFNYVNVEKITFSYSGDILTISDSTLGPPAVQPPFSLLAANYLNTDGTIQDSQTFEITLNDSLDDGSTLNVDIPKVLSITGNNTVTLDNNDNQLSSIQITGTASFTPPTLTQVSPSGSITTTNSVLANEVTATGVQSIANVEFFWNGLDFGEGSLTGSSLWSQVFALTPGINRLTTLATDVGGNNSASNTVTVTYVNHMTNANGIQFSEQSIDTAQLDSFDATAFAFNQDAGALNAALLVPGLQAMPGSTWSNLDLILSFGDINFSNNLTAADVLTSNSATFYVTDFDLGGNLFPVEQLTLTRAGNTLILFKRTSNPTYASYDNTPIIADSYRGMNAAFHNQRPFSLSLLNGTTLAPYTNYSQTIYVTGTDTVSYDDYSNELDNIQVSGQADYAPPSVTITSPTPGQLWSNSVFTVTGKAADNVLVTNVVFSLNNGAWTQVTPVNPWTNWTAQVNLLPGTNTVAVYAVDSNGNISPTNQVKVVYVISALLTVNQTGLGTITTNYNGMLLPLGKIFSMTAKPATGFAFTGWTGSLSTNSPTLIFTMASNLVFTANFIDTNRPTVTITAPTAGQLWSNSVFVVTGKATDNVSVTNVLLSLNGGAWGQATNLSQWTNWSATVNLTPGTNTLAAYSVDSSGNISPTNQVKVVYILSAPLTVNQIGLGTITTNYNGVLLPLGKIFSMTARPATGFRFTGWTGSLSTNSPTLIFTMASNLVFTASFADTNIPTLSITNLAAGQHVSNAVFTVRGTTHDNWLVGSVTYQINGTGWTNAVSANTWTNWYAPLNLVPGTNTLLAYATDTSGNTSLTNTLKFVYVSSAVLQIQMTGLGKLTPNYSNAVLAIGQNFTISATPATGFLFTNWVIATNGIGAPYNKSNLVFMMVSNLSLQVNFVDTNKPTLTISSPTANQKMTNAIAVIRGTAADNWGISNVWYQFNSGGWVSAPTTNHWANWGQSMTLVTGTNKLSAFAVDLAGNYSATSSVNFVSASTFQLQLSLSGASPLLANGLSFSLQLSTNLSGHIQYSTNLINWVSLTTFKATNSVLNFRDPAATNSPRRFYRATVP